ncbi:SusC/RagA family TonB-linked outer membrane protein [Carboxylicivirga linearis]|uniref:TonB-dependent receptor n=1 Tax=Carboxylicivirga linearis TaxID=1628157 RepID=A0ABS5JVW3_9BACT|nr:TonB-dependent receptor [Carboxylicivirga linearis]MBS2098471.1 TonB-dependent receptor [Carboxylicivirga linearis]
MNGLKKRLISTILLLSVGIGLWAQQSHVNGSVTDAKTSEAIPGVTVFVKGTQRGSITLPDGTYSIKVDKGEVLVFSFIGYQNQEVVVGPDANYNILLQQDYINVDEVVVVGYGETKKGDLTGAVSNVSAKDFNQGVVTSPAQLINGKVSGVQVLSGTGSPTSGSSFRIRGGASLNASNDPLIVLDGVPLEAGGISGNSNNFLSLINPNDIESMTVLKDASSTAIYGSRASNGVIIITTKKGSKGNISVNANSTNLIQVKTKLPEMLSIGEFRNVVETDGSDAQRALLGNSNTNWNDEIFKMAFGTDNNVSISGMIGNTPVRLSAGYYNQDGILKTDNAERFTGSVNVSPSLLDDHLKFNLGVKGALNRNTFANTSAIWGGSTMNPTIPVYSGLSSFGGYTEAIDSDEIPVTGAVLNPLGLLNQYSSTSDVNRIISNVDMDYKFHFLPDLRFHATLGYDYAEGQGNIYVPEEAAQYYQTFGRDYTYGPQKNENKLLTTYLNYKKELSDINSNVDVTLGYDYQFWKSSTPAYDVLNVYGDVQSSTAAYDQRHALISYYGRLNYNFMSKYMLTATIRQDGTSRFSEDNRWGTFPSLALAWRLSEEGFLADFEALSNLKLRASYGITGQQEGIGNYNYLPVYTISQDGAQYIFGNSIVNTWRPEAYVSNLKWETTKSFNYGIDFGFINNRISGTVEYYTRVTEDLLATVPSAAGTNFDKQILTNVGNVDSEGVEVTINSTPIDNENWTWDFSFNATWQKQTIKNLSLNPEAEVSNTPVGPTIDSYYFQTFTEGYSPYMFYVYHQLYDESGKPIEGAYADLNGDGEINSDDLYHYQNPMPDYVLGFSTSVRYKDWSLSTSLRSYLNNYVYNGMSMNTGALGTMSYNAFQLNNLHKSYLETGFQSRQYLSDYYIENASFLRMDNLSLNYNFGRIYDLFNLNLTALVQNVFVITNYSGVDPEISNGVDVSFYPRPRIYSLSIGIDF